MKVFLDTNILLDYGQVRDDFLYAKAILELGERKRDYLEFSELPIYTSKEFLLYYFRSKD